MNMRDDRALNLGCDVPPEAEDVITKLWQADAGISQDAALSATWVAVARAWLTRILVDSAALRAHFGLLRRLGGSFVFLPRPRREGPEGECPPTEPAAAGYRHNEPLEERLALAVAEYGVRALKDHQVAELLLNPVALGDLSDLIDHLLPDAWLDEMGKVGRELMEKHNLSVPIPGEEESEPPPFASEEGEVGLALAGSWRGSAGAVEVQPGSWRLTFTDDAARALQRKIAEHLYGDQARDFALTLHRRSVAGQPGMIQFTLEVAPAPRVNDLEIAITFPGAEKPRTFLLEVPPEVRSAPDEEPRPSTTSEPCEPLPAATFAVQGGSEWRDEEWPPHFILRGRATEGPERLSWQVWCGKVS